MASKLAVADPVMEIAKLVVLGSDQSKAVRRLKDEDLSRLKEFAKVVSHLANGEKAAREVRKDVERDR